MLAIILEFSRLRRGVLGRPSLTGVAREGLQGLGFQRLHVDAETVVDRPLEHPLVSLVDLLNGDDFNLAGDVVLAAEI